MWDLFKKYDVFTVFKNELYNLRVRVGYKRLTWIKDEFKQMYLEALKKDFEKVKKETFFDDFYENLIERNQRIYSLVLELDSPSEIILSIDNFDYARKIKKLKKENRRLKKENKELKKINDEILSSNSWKMTKSLRSIRNVLK